MVYRASQLGEVRATLIVNCKPGRPLHKMGIAYDESASVIKNLVGILGKLIFEPDTRIIVEEVEQCAQYRDALVLAGSVAKQALEHWDAGRDAKVGKILRALAGDLPGYMPETASIHAALKGET